MLFDFSKVIVNLDGVNIENPCLEETDEKRKLWTVHQACISAVLMPTPKKQETGDVKFKAYELATKIKACDPSVVDLSVDELKIVKDAVGRPYGAVVVGFIWKILNGEGIDSQS